eukprot:COSAG05_NODE_130_length_17165_cov_154.623638_31_plen_117_part_00
MFCALDMTLDRRRVCTAGLLPPQSLESPSAATAWRRLSVLLKLLHLGIDTWGSPQDLYGLVTAEAKKVEAEVGRSTQRLILLLPSRITGTQTCDGDKRKREGGRGGGGRERPRGGR